MAARKRAPKAAAQQAQFVVNRYDAAGTGRRMAGWNPPSSGPNRAIEGLQKIRDRQRDSTRNDWASSAGVQRWTTNLIGTGIVPRFNAVKDEAARERVTRLFERWVRESDADGNSNWYGQQTLAAMTWFTGGECLPRLRYRRPGSGLVVGLQVQLLEGEMAPLLDADNYPFMPTGNRIRSGRELNNIGRTVAWWLYKDHPGDGQRSALNPSQLVRVPADQMLHVFEPKRTGQLRGVPDFAPVLSHLRNIMDFNDAVLERQKLANLFAAFIKKPAGADMGNDTDPITGMPLGGSEPSPIGLEPGVVHQLMAGESMEFANPPEAGTVFSDYMRTQQTYTAAGQNLPYELLSGDIQNVSDRTLRIVMNEFRRFAEQRQWQILIPKLCQPVIDAWVDQAVLEGSIPAALADDCKAVEHQPQGWAYIHPVQDVQAKALEVQAGFRSKSSVIGERGDDPRKVAMERKADHDLDESLGLSTTDVQIDPTTGKAIQKPGPKPSAPAPAPKNEHPGLDALTASVGRLEAFVHAKASEPRAEPQSVVINNHIPQTRVSVTNAVEPTPVTIENNVAAPNVSVTNSVEPTPVTIENNVAAPNVSVTNDVKPADVKVELPARETSSIIERDSGGNITNVTQTERTIQ